MREALPAAGKPSKLAHFCSVLQPYPQAAWPLQLRVCPDLLLQLGCLKTPCNRHTHKPFHKHYKQPPQRGLIYSAQMQQQSWQQPLFLPNKLLPSHRASHRYVALDWFSLLASPVCLFVLSILPFVLSILPLGLPILPLGLFILPFGLSSLRASSPVTHLLFLSSHCSMLQSCTTSCFIQYPLSYHTILPA